MKTGETNKEEQQDQLIKRPKILPLPNGPYYLINELEQVVEIFKIQKENLFQSCEE
jgi:hypothetical protein